MISRKLFGLEDGGKRIYRFEEGEVDQETFEYCVQMMDLVFGHNGLVDTLGPTWNMVHDPRFEAVEECFLYNRRPVFGGDPRQGTQTCLPDGTFVSGMQDLEQYSEILTEGRHYQQTVVGMGINPHEVHTWDDDRIWKLIKQENTQQFSRTGVPNMNAKIYFKMIKADLIGLVDDYAELAKCQEWVLLEENGRLVEAEDIAKYEEDGSHHRVWLEVDLLEKALTYRASLRVTASMILNKLNIEKVADMVTGQLTDGERDTLMKIVYGGKWPEGRTDMLTQIMGYFGSLKLQGTFEQRLAMEKLHLSAESKAYIAGLKATQVKIDRGEELTDDDIKPVTRYMEPVIEVESSPEEIAMMDILNNPLKQYTLVRLSDAERRVELLDKQIEVQQEDIDKIEDEEAKLEATNELLALQAKRSNLQQVADLLLPLMDPSCDLRDEQFADAMTKAEVLDPGAVPQALELPPEAFAELPETVN